MTVDLAALVVMLATVIVDLAAVVGELPAVVGELAVPGLAAVTVELAAVLRPQPRPASCPRPACDRHGRRPGRRDRRAGRPRPAATVIVDLAATVGELPAPRPGVAVIVELPVPGLRPP